MLVLAVLELAVKETQVVVNLLVTKLLEEAVLVRLVQVVEE
jgi:hypothetical protein